MTDKKLSKELGCLRIHLSGFLANDKLMLIEEAERRLKNPGAVSTNPAQSSLKKRGPKRSPKKEAFHKYFNK